jgi:cobalt-zinc-cadmium efflux system membrane fusion protein
MRARWIFLAFLIAGCHHAIEPENAVKRPDNEVWVTAQQIREAGITTDVVQERAIGNRLVATGRLAFSDARVSHIFSPVTGRLTKVRKGVGDSVKRGEALAIVQSPDLASAVADLQKAEADVAAARRDEERQSELYAAHAASQRDFEAADSTLRKAEAERDRAAQKCRLFQANAVDGGYVVRSPIAGEVIARAATSGMEVQGQYSGGNAQELFTVGNQDPVWVLADIFEIDLPRVRAGAPVEVSVVAYPGRKFEGTVDWISGTLDPATRSAKVRCVIRNSDHLLRPEMFAVAAIATDAAPRLAAPRSAIVRVGDQTIAYVDRGPAPNGGERFERRMVSIDDSQAAQFVPIVDGLRSGERVVSSGALVLSGESS